MAAEDTQSEVLEWELREREEREWEEARGRGVGRGGRRTSAGPQAPFIASAEEE
jgi:hypothetical protein